MDTGKIRPCKRDTLDELVVAFCADYERRKSCVLDGSVGARCSMEYEYINHRIWEGAAEVVGAGYAELYINEIGSKTGYANSKHTAATESTYKLEKKEVKQNIARKLHLVG